MSFVEWRRSELVLSEVEGVNPCLPAGPEPNMVQGLPAEQDATFRPDGRRVDPIGVLSILSYRKSDPHEIRQAMYFGDERTVFPDKKV